MIIRMALGWSLAAALAAGGGVGFAQGFKPSRNIEFVTSAASVPFLHPGTSLSGRAAWLPET